MKLLFFGGKGGVGKTTCSAAFALAELATRGRALRRVLLVSTDPAHSLGDALDVRLSSVPRPIRRGLDAVELDARRAFDRWLREHRRALGDILEHGTWLDREDVDALLDLSFPGVDELVGLLEISRVSRVTRYDIAIVDAAPTGHLLRLLAAPETVGVVAGVLDDLQAEHRLIRDQIARVRRGPEAADRVIELLADGAQQVARRLRDPQQCALRWVTLPERMSVEETADAIAALTRSGMNVDEVIINRVLPQTPRCPLCQRRRSEEQKAIATIRRRFAKGRTIRTIPAELSEPRGVRALTRLGARLVRGRAEHALDDRGGAVHPRLAPRVAHEAKRKDHLVTASLGSLERTPLIFIGGKGGVGKTTVAASMALHIARGPGQRRVLLLSTDPAHSIGDVLEAPVSDTPAPLPAGPRNLLVRELDAARALVAKRDQLEDALNEIASAFGAPGAALHASELMSLAPPGIDELFAVLSVVDAREDFDSIVVDTAPTGHALQLLETPKAASEWIQALLRVLLKYRRLVRPGHLAQELLALSKSVRALQTMLRDQSQTEFVIVTRASEVQRFETERLITRLTRLQLASRCLIVNALTMADDACERCRLTMTSEHRSLDRLRRAWRRGRSDDCAIIHTPLWAPPPIGARALERWMKEWKTES